MQFLLRRESDILSPYDLFIFTDVTLAECDCKLLECMQSISNQDSLASLEEILFAGRCPHLIRYMHAADSSDVTFAVGVYPIHIAVGKIIQAFPLFGLTQIVTAL